MLGLGLTVLWSHYQTLPVYFGYLTEGHKNMLRRVLMSFTFHGYDLDQLNETPQDKLFHHCRCQRHCIHHLFTAKSRPPGPMHLGKRGHDFCCQTSNTILINATLLLLHFFVIAKFYVFVFMCTCMYSMNCFFVDNVLLSCVNMCACVMSILQ